MKKNVAVVHIFRFLLCIEKYDIIKTYDEMEGYRKLTLNGINEDFIKATEKYTEDFSLIDVIETLPVYTTTGVSETRALLKIKTTDHSVLKAKYQKVFLSQWEEKEPNMF